MAMVRAFLDERNRNTFEAAHTIESLNQRVCEMSIWCGCHCAGRQFLKTDALSAEPPPATFSDGLQPCNASCIRMQAQYLELRNRASLLPTKALCAFHHIPAGLTEHLERTDGTCKSVDAF